MDKSGSESSVVPSSSSCIHGKLKAQHGRRLRRLEAERRGNICFDDFTSHKRRRQPLNVSTHDAAGQPAATSLSLLSPPLWHFKEHQTFQNKNAYASSPYPHPRSDSSTPLMPCFVVIVLFFTSFFKGYVRPH